MAMAAPSRAPAHVVSWFVVNREAPLAFVRRQLRVHATYSDGSVRVLRAAFSDRASLDKYLRRFHPDYFGKEIDPPSEPGLTP
jgi:hypothetical protein